MAISGDVEKRRMWTARFAKYRASGLSVSRFCKQEGVSPHTFYYWAKRLRATTRAPSRDNWAARTQHASAKSPIDSSVREAMVRFHCRSGAEVVVPADCLEAIRCLAKCLTEAGDSRGEAFQEVVVKA